MKSVGIKVLKDKLSSYLKLVKEGEVVLVTDRDEVIAEIRKPRAASTVHLSRFEQFLQDAAARGSVKLASSQEVFPKSMDQLIEPPIKVDAMELLNETREDRFE